MSDFLTSLAARTGPSAEAVQPRLPSLFEPKRLGVASLVNARSEATEQEEHVQEERPSNYERSTVQRRARLDSLTDRRQETAVESAKKPAPISGRSHPASFPARAEVGTQPFAAVIPRSAEPQHPATLSSQGQPAVSFESKKEVEPRWLPTRCSLVLTGKSSRIGRGSRIQKRKQKSRRAALTQQLPLQSILLDW